MLIASRIAQLRLIIKIFKTMNTTKIIYYISTGLFSALMLMSAGMYLFNYEEIEKTFLELGYPAYIIIPLAIAKILGVIAVWTKLSPFLREWAYAGFFYDALLALSAHLVAQDGAFGGALIALILILTSYWTDKQLAKQA